MFGMGFNSAEKVLYKQHVKALTIIGMRRRDARQVTKQLLKQAIAESKATGFYGLGPVGAFKLQDYRTNPKRAEYWEALQGEGVTEEDVLVWWDLSEVERWLIRLDDRRDHLAAFEKRLSLGDIGEEAARFIWRTYPVFGVCTKPPAFPDDDTSVPLPEELKNRVLSWTENAQMAGQFEELKAEAASFPTMNAYIRQLIRMGRI